MLLLLPSVEMLLIKRKNFSLNIYGDCLKSLSYLLEVSNTGFKYHLSEGNGTAIFAVGQSDGEDRFSRAWKTIRGRARIGMGSTCFFPEDVKRLLLEETVQ